MTYWLALAVVMAYYVVLGILAYGYAPHPRPQHTGNRGSHTVWQLIETLEAEADRLDPPTGRHAWHGPRVPLPV